MEEVLVDPILESSGAWRSIEESTAATSELGGSEQLALTADGSAMVLGATAEAAGSSTTNAGDADAAPESGAAKLVVPEEQTTPPRHHRAWSDPLSSHGTLRWCL